MKITGGILVPFLRGFLVVTIVTSATHAVAKDEVERFDNGPLLSEPGQYFEMSTDVLNEPANSPVRQSGIAFVERIVGGRSAHAEFIAGQSGDELARGYMVSVDGWLAASAKQAIALELSANPATRDLGNSLLAGTTVMPDGSQMRLPPGQTISLHHGGILVTGDALLERAAPKWLAGEYLASSIGKCPFEDGPIRIIQDRFLLEGHRGDRLLFWGAVGVSTAYFEAAENKFVKITLMRRKKSAVVEFPDQISELFSARLDSRTLILGGEFLRDCEIRLEPQFEPLIDSPPVTRPTRFGQEPAEDALRKDDTPGVMLSAQETKRQVGQDGTIEITYGLKATGFPQGRKFSLWRYRPLSEATKLIETLSVDETGIMMVDEMSSERQDEWQSSPLETSLPLTLHHFQKGESFEFGVVSEDGTVAAYAKIFPDPIEANEGDCYVFLEQLDTRRTMFAAYGEGFRPSELIAIESYSGEIALPSSYTADEYGRFIGYAFPQIAGETFGPARLSVQSEHCSVFVEYEWGRR